MDLKMLLDVLMHTFDFGIPFRMGELECPLTKLWQPQHFIHLPQYHFNVRPQFVTPESVTSRDQAVLHTHYLITELYRST